MSPASAYAATKGVVERSTCHLAKELRPNCVAALFVVRPKGIEPLPQAPEAYVLSIGPRARMTQTLYTGCGVMRNSREQFKNFGSRLRVVRLVLERGISVRAFSCLSGFYPMSPDGIGGSGRRRNSQDCQN